MALEIADRSMAALLRAIAGNLQEIVRAEVRLAATEVREELARAKQASMLIVVGSAFGLLALGFVLLGARDLLAEIVTPWLAAMIVALGAGAVGITLIAIGVRHLKVVKIPPPRTLVSVQENLQWAKAHVK